MAGDDSKKRQRAGDAEEVEEADGAAGPSTSRRRQDDVKEGEQEQEQQQQGLDADGDDEEDEDYKWLKGQLQHEGQQMAAQLMLMGDGHQVQQQQEEGDEEGDAEEAEEPDWDDGCGGRLKQLLAGAAAGNLQQVQHALEEAGTSGAAGKALDINTPAPDGDTALHLASLFGHADVAALLISKGADAGALNPEDGSTPLHDAAASGETEILRQLVKAAPQAVRVADQDGDTPLHNAARGGHLECTKLLLEAGADPKAKNEQGHTPLQESDDKDVIGALTSAAS